MDKMAEDGWAEGESHSFGEMLGGLMGGSGSAISTSAAGYARSSYSEFTDDYLQEEDSKLLRPRMINYRGNIRMQSAEPEAVIDTVVERAKAKGGSVDNRRNGYVSLQIPVGEFKSFFEFILTLGNVTSKSISASDITDAFTDNAARLRIAERSLARMQELLAVAKTEQEKIALLKEIQRLSEQIEQRKLEEKELLRKAEFSNITLSVSNMPPPVVPAPIKIGAFEWFSRLLNTNEFSKKDAALKLDLPKDFIEIKSQKSGKHRWRSASALNTQFWAFEKKNNPKGTADFWSKAMLEFFKSTFSAELKTEENYSLIRLQNFNNEPEVYYIAILKTSNEKTLKIAQAYFPNKEAEEKNSEAIKEILRRAK